MPFATNMFVVGPVIALGVVAALAAVLRWTFDSEFSRHVPRVFNEPDAHPDYGLLSVAGVVETEPDARALQEVLAGAGIRSTTATADNGHVRVLVFSSELETARRLVGGSAP